MSNITSKIKEYIKLYTIKVKYKKLIKEIFQYLVTDTKTKILESDLIKYKRELMKYRNIQL